MQVKATVKIEILEGEEKGMIDTFSTIGETDTQYTGYGIIERLRLEWRHIHNIHLVDEQKGDKNVSENDNRRSY